MNRNNRIKPHLYESNKLNLTNMSRDQLQDVLEEEYELSQVSVSEIDLSKLCYIDEAKKLAAYHNVRYSDIKILACLPVAEDCIYVKGEWKGYLDEHAIRCCDEYCTQELNRMRGLLK